MKTILPALFILILSSSQAWSASLKCSAAFREPLTANEIQALTHRLDSVKSDDPQQIKMMTPHEKHQHEVAANDLGMMYYKNANQFIWGKESKGEFLIIWDYSYGTAGKLYGRFNDAFDGKEMKHSSFNGNKTVLGAWSLRIDKGFIVEISQNSGHYLTPALNTLLFVRQLEAQGFDLSRARVHLPYAFGPLMAMRLKVSDFKNFVESLSEKDLTEYGTKGRADMTPIMDQFLSHTDNLVNHALASLGRIRSKDPMDKIDPHLPAIAAFLDAPQFSAYLKSRFLSGLFTHRPSVKGVLRRSSNNFAENIPHGFRDDIYEGVITKIKSHMENTESKSFVDQWFSEQRF